jgi:hypothetical protein
MATLFDHVGHFRLLFAKKRKNLFAKGLKFLSNIT